MRLFEADDKFLDVLKLILRNQIKRADAKQAPQVYTFQGLSELLKTQGYGPISFNEFEKLYNDQSTDLQTLISNYNEDTITLKTKEEIQSEPEDLDALGAPSVDQLAARGAKDLS